MSEERISDVEWKQPYDKSKFNCMYELKVGILSRSSTISYILRKCNWMVIASTIGLILEKPAPNGHKVFLAYEEYKAAKDLDEIITILVGRLREELDKELLREL